MTPVRNTALDLTSFLKFNTQRRRRRDKTVESRRVGGVNTPVGSRELGHGRRLRYAFASPNPSAVVANSCTHRRRRRDATKQFHPVGVGGVYLALIIAIRKRLL